MKQNRKDILLRAAYDLLKQASEDHFVRSADEITTYYDEADCDGHCLMEDIAMELGIETSEEPLRRDRAQQMELGIETSEEPLRRDRAQQPEPDDDVTAYKRQADAEGER